MTHDGIVDGKAKEPSHKHMAKCLNDACMNIPEKVGQSRKRGVMHGFKFAFQFKFLFHEN